MTIELKNQTSIIVTPKASLYIQEKLKSTEGALGFRIGLKPAGCSGYTYRVEIATIINQDDIVIDVQTFKIIVDTTSLKFLKGTIIDCIQEGLNEFLKFKNPNVKGECGCGESFSIEAIKD